MTHNCPYCREAILETELVECPTCRTPHHRDCWNENGGCTVFGCDHAPTDDPKIAVTTQEIGSSAVDNQASYLVLRDGQQFGPYSIDQIQGYSSEGRINPNDLVWTQGMAQWVPLSQILGALHPPPYRSSTVPSYSQQARFVPNSDNGLFLYIPTGRLVGMTFLSYGLYGAYWIYKNWKYLKERDKLKIHPLGRGIFGVFFIAQLLKAIHGDREANRIAAPQFNASALGTGYIVLILIGYLFSKADVVAVCMLGSVISMCSCLCLLPVQQYINTVNQSTSPSRQYNEWSPGHIVCVVLGIIFWLVMLLALAGSK